MEALSALCVSTHLVATFWVLSAKLCLVEGFISSRGSVFCETEASLFP